MQAWLLFSDIELNDTEKANSGEAGSLKVDQN